MTSAPATLRQPSSHPATTRITTSSSPLLSSLSLPPVRSFVFQRSLPVSAPSRVRPRHLESHHLLPASPRPACTLALALRGSPCRGAAQSTRPCSFRQAYFAKKVKISSKIPHFSQNSGIKWAQTGKFSGKACPKWPIFAPECSRKPTFGRSTAVFCSKGGRFRSYRGGRARISATCGR